MSRDLANAVPTVCCDAVSETFFAVSYSDDSLAVAIPRNVIDAARNDVIFSCFVLAFIEHSCRMNASPLVAPSPTQSQTLTEPVTSPLAI